MDFEIISQLIRDKKYSLLRKELKIAQVADLGEFIDSLDAHDALLVFRLLPKEIAADVFSYLSVERQTDLSQLVNEKELSEILNDLYFDDKIDFLEEMPANFVKKALKHSSQVERDLINQFLQYPDYSAGSLMTIEFVDLKKEMRVEEALERVRLTAPDKETVYICYVTGAQRHLEGIVSLKDLVLARTGSKVGDIMLTDPIYVNTHDDQEFIADIFKKYDLLALPVADNENRLVGIITIDDIIDVIEEESTEDILRMAAVQPTEEEYLNAGVFTLARKRIAWLLVLMISAAFTGYIIRSFEAVLQTAVALTAFIPMLTGTGGNAGSQASTLQIRSIVLGEVQFRDTFKVIFKEMRVGLLTGSCLAIVNFLRIYFLEGYSAGIALTVTGTLVLTVTAAKVVGGVLPIIAKKLHLDPAIMASPLISTIVDAFTLVIYFSLATVILGI